MSNYPLYTIETAPQASKAALAQLQTEIGFLPNLAAAMADSPAMITAFINLRAAYSLSSLPPVERELILLATAVQYRNAYGVAVHSTVAKGLGAAEAVLATLRAGQACPDSRVDAIARLARSASRGEPLSSSDLEIASIVGLRNHEVLDIMTGVAIGNLVASMFLLAPDTPLDSPFESQAWQGNNEL